MGLFYAPKPPKFPPMIIVPPLHPVPEALRHCVVAIGNFDGVHLGHNVVFELARKRAKDLNAPFVILTFDPHPRLFFRPDSEPFLLTPPTLKFERFQKALADGVVVLPFDRVMADHTPQAFIDEVLVAALDARHVVVGRDFHFGHDRAGTNQTILDAGIPVLAVDVMQDRTGAPYSSTRVREFLKSGDVANANRLLGWNWEIRGVVVPGDQRGRTLGYPTANVNLRDTLHPAYGVYASMVQIEGEAGIWHKAAVNIGVRPMFAVATALLEAHILDFNADLYGKTLRIRPVAKLRDEARFADLDGLVRQIERDCQAARKILEN